MSTVFHVLRLPSTRDCKKLSFLKARAFELFHPKALEPSRAHEPSYRCVCWFWNDPGVWLLHYHPMLRYNGCLWIHIKSLVCSFFSWSGSNIRHILVDFLKIVVILRAKWALQGSRVEGSRARALFGPEPARAQARLVQTLVTRSSETTGFTKDYSIQACAEKGPLLLSSQGRTFSQLSNLSFAQPCTYG